ncbi:TetR/AcrR family transcriptional regulator [Algihabitans albus]|uniref:TetR/AcrR family transcriptional regulator n=1 Tax=Algihabitans albus TaxID=2164067 RepID=UPI000E5C701A|nr:TetR/AcrR family transcriptional regulator [Algihabitans albus]
MARVRAAEYDDKRDAILDRAAELFAANGFARTSMNAISEACGASKAALYHYYVGKDALLFDILDSHIRFLLDTVEAVAAAEPDPETRLYRLTETLMQGYADADAKHKVLLNEMGSLDPDKRETIRFMERRIVAVFAETLQELNPALARPELSKPVTMSLLGMLNWHYTWLKPGGPLTRETYARLATDLFLKGAAGLE